eukprot:8950803-Pyramimonas_sp.AAC.1
MGALVLPLPTLGRLPALTASAAFLFAPAAASSTTMSVCSVLVAMWRGVSPCALCRSSSAPTDTSSINASNGPSVTAQCTGVLPICDERTAPRAMNTPPVSVERRLPRS